MSKRKLKGKIIESGLSFAEISKRMNIHPSTLYRKINNVSSMTVGEAVTLSKILNLTTQDIDIIFFNC